jgi:hypothetical protein
LLVALTKRRLLWFEADGSAVGAGGMGAASSAGEAVVVAGALMSLPAAQPQLGATAQALQLEQLLQLLQLLQQRLLQLCRQLSRPPWQWCLWQQLFPQHELQGEAQPQAAGAAQLGAAAHSQLGAAAQAGASQAGAPHEGAAQPQPLLQLLQQPLWQPQPNNLLCKPPNRPPQQWWWQHFCLQHFGAQHDCWAQHDGAAQHEGAAHDGAAQHEGAQLAFAWQQVSQPFSQPQDGWQAGWQQLLHPQSFRPIMRSRSSKPKLWLHRPTLTTSAPKTMFHFIEQRLLYLNCG